jgi:preprotein translocase subunit SecY
MTSWIERIATSLPEVQAPTQKRLGFKEKMKWTVITLVLFFVLGLVPLFGLGQNALQQFEFLSVLLGAQFGSIISLGIGPLVTASIILQLLNGAGILKFDLNSHDGRMKFQGLQKIFNIFFIVFEAIIYIFLGGLAPPAAITGGLHFQLQLLLVAQLILGGFLIMYMDEVISKWGFSSGISLFIAANVAQSLFIRALSPLAAPLNPTGGPTGAIPILFRSLSSGDLQTSLLQVGAIVATLVVFAFVVYVNGMKVEIPLSFGRVRGHGIRWPLQFMYTSNIPVILIAALFANIQLWARLLQNWGYPLLGTFAGNAPASGLIVWLSPPNLLQSAIQGSLQFSFVLQAIVYVLALSAGSIVFSWFWVQTSGMDAQSQAKKIMSSGLQIPGFRKDQRVLERVLGRYIGPLSVLGGLAVGLLAGLADISGTLTSGTGLLLAVMIVFKLYEEIANDHMMDMNPMLRKFMGGK